MKGDGGIEARGTETSRARRLTLLLSFSAWGALMLVLGTVLMAGHWVVLPVPEPTDAALRDALAKADRPVLGRWQLVHVLYAECRCSQRILEYLSHRALPAGTLDRVLFVGHGDPRSRELAARGVLVEELTRRQLVERFHIESAPLLIIIDPHGSVRYLGGYTPRQQGLDFQDLTLLAELRRDHALASLPAYGCGVSQRLQAYLDPLGIKYLR